MSQRALLELLARLGPCLMQYPAQVSCAGCSSMSENEPGSKTGRLEQVRGVTKQFRLEHGHDGKDVFWAPTPDAMVTVEGRLEGATLHFGYARPDGTTATVTATACASLAKQSLYGMLWPRTRRRY